LSLEQWKKIGELQFFALFCLCDIHWCVVDINQLSWALHAGRRIQFSFKELKIDACFHFLEANKTFQKLL